MARRQIRFILDNPEFVKSYLIPASIFLLDFFLRVILEVDLIDAGADMALIGVATFFAILVEDADDRHRYAPVGLIFALLFMILWMLCLRIVANDTPILWSWTGENDLRLFFSWFLGLVTFVLSGIVTNEILADAAS